jgi:hypoxanthine phosphoribosyltransferase
VDAGHLSADLDKILLSETDIQRRISEMAADIERYHEGVTCSWSGAQRRRHGHGGPVQTLSRHVETDWMAVSSYGSGAKSGVVASSRTSTPTSPAGTCSSSKTSSTPA